MDTKKTLLLTGTALLVIFLALGCSQGKPQDAGSAAGGGSAIITPDDTAGFEEFSIGDDQELGPLNVAGVYFQPVDMEPASLAGLPASQSDMHIEADISALSNDLGYGIGDFVPNLTVKYEITQAGWKSEGTFMPMSASDGPHYGANVKLNGIGDYHVRFIIETPEAQGYLLHVDETTGVKGKFWREPLVAEWDFNYPGPSW